MSVQTKLEATKRAIVRSKNLSLYEYFGTAVGKELGRKVYQKCYETGFKTGRCTVDNKGYTGEVNTYPELFLNMYFTLHPQDIPEKVQFEIEVNNLTY